MNCIPTCTKCLGHGSGKTASGRRPRCTEGLRLYYRRGACRPVRTLTYVADPKLVELGLTPSADAYKAQFYTLSDERPDDTACAYRTGKQRGRGPYAQPPAHSPLGYMRKGAADKVVELVKKDGKTYVVINDYEKVRELFGELFAEIQRIKSTGDYDAARELVESYAVKVDPNCTRKYWNVIRS